MGAPKGSNKPNGYTPPEGRWPANLIHDGSPDVLDLFAQFGEKTSNGQRKPFKVKRNTIYGNLAGATCDPYESNTGTAARFFYCAKASKADRDAGLDDMPERKTSYMCTHGGNPDKGRAWSPVDDTTGKQRNRFEAAKRNTHPTVKPRALMEYLCRLVTPPGGTILDPFMGSGSTGIGAALGGFSFIGCDLSAEYVEISRRRIAAARKKPAQHALPLLKAAA